jgi:hypothetical protein
MADVGNIKNEVVSIGFMDFQNLVENELTLTSLHKVVQPLLGLIVVKKDAGGLKSQDLKDKAIKSFGGSLGLYSIKYWHDASMLLSSLSKESGILTITKTISLSMGLFFASMGGIHEYFTKYFSSLKKIDSMLMHSEALCLPFFGTFLILKAMTFNKEEVQKTVQSRSLFGKDLSKINGWVPTMAQITVWVDAFTHGIQLIDDLHNILKGTIGEKLDPYIGMEIRGSFIKKENLMSCIATLGFFNHLLKIVVFLATKHPAEKAETTNEKLSKFFDNTSNILDIIKVVESIDGVAAAFQKEPQRASTMDIGLSLPSCNPFIRQKEELKQQRTKEQWFYYPLVVRKFVRMQGIDQLSYLPVFLKKTVDQTKWLFDEGDFKQLFKVIMPFGFIKPISIYLDKGLVGLKNIDSISHIAMTSLYCFVGYTADSSNRQIGFEETFVGQLRNYAIPLAGLFEVLPLLYKWTKSVLEYVQQQTKVQAAKQPLKQAH